MPFRKKKKNKQTTANFPHHSLGSLAACSLVQKRSKGTRRLARKGFHSFPLYPPNSKAFFQAGFHIVLFLLDLETGQVLVSSEFDHIRAGFEKKCSKMHGHLCVRFISLLLVANRWVSLYSNMLTSKLRFIYPNCSQNHTRISDVLICVLCWNLLNSKRILLGVVCSD